MQHWFEKHPDIQRRRAEGEFDGFTLIELLIVIVVLGILAATVIIALGGVTGQSKAAACNSDAKSLEEAATNYKEDPHNSTNTWPAAIGDLTKTDGPLGTGTGPFLRQLPTDTNGYKLSLGTSNGQVFVSIKGGAAINYDTQTKSTGCNSLAS